MYKCRESKTNLIQLQLKHEKNYNQCMLHYTQYRVHGSGRSKSILTFLQAFTSHLLSFHLEAQTFCYSHCSLQTAMVFLAMFAIRFVKRSPIAVSIIARHVRTNLNGLHPFTPPNNVLQ